jgi:hypothetical protein
MRATTLAIRAGTVLKEFAMTRHLLAATLAASLLAPLAASADDQPALDACIATWGKTSPFKKGTPAASTVATGVKVFGIGSSGTSDEATSKPSLVLVRPAVNVMGKSTLKLVNPNGWYCFVSNVNVAGKMEIELPCAAHMASAKEDGTAVGASDDSTKGVTVFGALRVVRVGCPEGKPKS